jgi:hypothetical protein
MERKKVMQKQRRDKERIEGKNDSVCQHQRFGRRKIGGISIFQFGCGGV